MVSVVVNYYHCMRPNLSPNCFLIEIHIVKKSLGRESGCGDEAQYVVSGGGGGTDIEDIHLAQFTFTVGAKPSPAGSENSLGTIIMILLPTLPSPTHPTLHTLHTVAQLCVRTYHPHCLTNWEFQEMCTFL